ncbi:MAG: acylneuraminate cytidylyltransferase family protein [Woeseiaceae bacterium]|nr:acylneuraminate cytidylyltransferase family protein [Woeseiaceae bacterium]
MNKFAFIFARGGSKGLKKKNIKIFGGKPLIAHTILQALDCQIFDKVFVSTDDNEIASISASFGAEVIIRPDYLAQDNSPEWLSWRHAISYTEENFGAFEKFISLPPTSPLRNKDDIMNAINHLNMNLKADLCLAISKSSRNPSFNMVFKDEKDFLELATKTEKPIIRRQDAKPIFDITTVIYVAKKQYIMEKEGIFSGSVIGFEIPRERAVDIDDILDFQFAEFLYEQLNYVE